MNSPFMVVNIVEGKLNAINLPQYDTFESALELAVKIAKEQSSISEKNIRKELKRDRDFFDPINDIRVYIWIPVKE